MSLRLIDCCRDREFISDFPYELAGAIHSDEFQQSIANINNARRKTLFEKIALVCPLLCSIIGLAILIVGLCLISLQSSVPWIVLDSVGVAVIVATGCIGLLVSICVTLTVVHRMEDAIAAESMRYSTRLPIPTRWRLNAYHFTVGSGKRRRSYTVYSVSSNVTEYDPPFM